MEILSQEFSQTIIRPALSVRLIKRSIDIFFGLIGSALFLFLYPFIALAIKLESRGPVVYRQTRVGINDRTTERRNISKRIIFLSERRKDGLDRRGEDVCGSPFTLFKFRTMSQDAEKNGPQLCAKKADPRVTKVGCWLRYFHLDELPQFISVLKGDMSLIGPRPERPFFTRQYVQEIPYYQERTRFVKPGITGLAQITLGYDESLQSVSNKYYYDVTYRLSMSSMTSWFRMEGWVFFNTFKYLMNQLRLFRSFSLTKENTEFSSNSNGNIHIAHPWKLIEKLSARKWKSGPIPEFLDGWSPQSSESVS